ncbi:MAG: TRAFs-binding domain-containing protein [Acidobacteriota bacterium]
MARATKTKGSAAAAEKQKTCFVVTGFGRKTDFQTGRVLDLDKTWEQIVQPAFDRVNVNAFRAIDANLTGSIDSIMYQWLYAADIVIADLSTFNSNVFYELGVRHAQKPNTTIMIAENGLMSRIPFDIGHYVIHSYEHGGDRIADEEAERFVGHLAKLMQDIIDIETERQATSPGSERENDSPIFTFLPGMKPPDYKLKKHLAPPAYVQPDLRPKELEEAGESLASVIAAAETAKNRKNYDKAIKLFSQAIEEEEKTKAQPDVYLAQRLALVTYKAGEVKDENGNVDKAKAKKELIEAELILAKYCNPKETTDPETLGLSGAINKRLFDLTEDTEYLDRSIAFYERGFYVKQDYYNGINVAFMYTMKANLEDNHREAVVFYGHGNLIRQRVAEICQELADDQEAFSKRDDQQWVLMTLAEAHLGMENLKAVERLEPKIEAVIPDGDTFSMDSYRTQQEKLRAAIAEFYAKHPVGVLNPQQPVIDAPPAAAAPAAAAPASDKTTTAADAATSAPSPAAAEWRSGSEAASGSGVFVGDPKHILPGKPIRSVQVKYKIEYAD